jgi:hypothetical protein
MTMPTDVNNLKDHEVPMDYVRMYYEHQYDRLAKLEEQSLAVTNIVITLSVAVLAFGFSYGKTLGEFAGIVLAVAVVLLNLFAIAFLVRTTSFTRIHKRRAKRILEVYTPELYQFDKSMPFTPLSITLGRDKIILAIHILLIPVALVLGYSYLVGTK